MAGDYRQARTLHERMLPMVQTLFIETSPAPVKAAMTMLGWCGPELRLPLVEISEATSRKLRAELEAFGVLPAGAQG